jgi:hypothetical protein
MAIEDEIGYYKQKKELLEENLKLQEKLLKAQNDAVSELELELGKRAERNKLDKEYLELLGKSDAFLASQIDNLTQQLVAEEKRRATAEGRGRLTNEELEAKELELAQLQIIIAMEGDHKKLLQEQLADRIKINQEFEKTVGHAKKFGDRMQGLLGIGLEFEETFIGGFTQAGKLMFDMSLEAGKLGKVMSSGLTAMAPKMLGLIATRTEEVFVKTDELISSFVRATGANAAFRETLAGSITSMRNLGLSMDAAGAAATALYNNTVSFKDESRAAQKEMVVFTATLEQAGVSATSTADSILILAKTLNITGNQAKEEASKLITLADSLSVAPQQMMSDFAQASSVLSAHGDNMMNVFSELAAASRATGLEMGNLLTIAGQFDTFDSSADAVGRLNGMLGGPYLNSLEMVYMSESERIRAMLQSIELSGASWASMGRLEKRAFAAAAGISDMAQANKLFGGGLSAYDEAQAKTSLQAAEQEKLNELAKQATTLMQNLQNSLNALAVALAPVLTLFRGIVDVMSALLGSFNGMGATILTYTAIIWKLVPALSIMFTKIIASTNANWLLVASQKVLNVVQAIGSKWMIALGLAAAALHMALTQPGSPPLYLALMIVAGGIFLLGRASETSAIGLLAAGAGVALIGAGVWLAGLGIEYMANAFVMLFTAVSGNLADFAVFGLILNGILMGLGIFGPLAAVGIAALGVSLLVFGPMMAAGITAIAASIYLLGRAINSIDKDIMISFKAFTSGFETLANLPAEGDQAFERMIKTISKIEPVHVENVQDIVDETQRYVAVQATAKVMGVTPLLDALTKKEEKPAAAAAPSQPQPVTIVLDVPGQHTLRLAGKLLVDKGYFGTPANQPKQY